jgi:hypothetical protein
MRGAAAKLGELVETLKGVDVSGFIAVGGKGYLCGYRVQGDGCEVSGFSNGQPGWEEDLGVAL